MLATMCPKYCGTTLSGFLSVVFEAAVCGNFRTLYTQGLEQSETQPRVPERMLRILSGLSLAHAAVKTDRFGGLSAIGSGSDRLLAGRRENAVHSCT